MERSVADWDRLLREALPAAGLYAVGGRVRNEVLAELGQRQEGPPDLDYLVTGMALDDIVSRLSRLGSAEMVGASFGVIKFTIEGTTVDVALPRREWSTGAHHRDFKVESGPAVPLEEDLSRRDFRMNMMARDLHSGTLVDPFSGRADLEHRRLDVLREEAFLEDPLRILRGAQFAARFELRPTTRTLDAMRRAAQLVGTVAAERVTEELAKLLELAEEPSVGFEVLREVGALQYVLPELLEGWGVDQNEFHRYTVYFHSLYCCDRAPPTLVGRLAALMHDVGKPRTKDGPHFYRHEFVGEEMTRAALSRLRFPGDVVERVSHLVANHMYAAYDELSDAAIRRFIRRVGVAAVIDLFALRKADIESTGIASRRESENERFEQRVHAQIRAPHVFSIADLAINGEDVIAVMREQGLVGEAFAGDRRVGAALRHCLEQVLEDPGRNTPDALRALVRAFFA